MAEITVRDAKQRDAAELARLRWEFRPESQQAQEFNAFSKDFESWFGQILSSGEWAASVAEVESGALVGCIFLRSVDKVPDPGAVQRSWGYVTNSYVTPAYRNRGVGRRLLDHVIEEARRRRHGFLIVWPSKASLPFYARSGFREVVDVHIESNDHPPLELVLS